MLTELKSSYGLTYTMHAPFCSLNLAGINPKLREASINEIVRSIAYANELECELVVVHPGIVSYPRNLPKFEQISKDNQYRLFFADLRKS